MCLACDEPLIKSGAFRLRIGAVDYKNNGTFFVQEPCDSFRDGSRTKWICLRCATDHNVFIDDLEYDVCGAIDGQTRCGQTFEPVNSQCSETVLLLEWGELTTNHSHKGPKVWFHKEIGGHIHFNCACDVWRIPLWDFEPQDAP